MAASAAAAASSAASRQLSAAVVSQTAGASSADSQWEVLAFDIDAPDLVPQVLEASDLDEADKVIGLLCGAVRALRSQKQKPDPLLCQSLAYLAKCRPSLFTTDLVVSALCSVLRKESSPSSHSYKTKSVGLCVLAACILYKAFADMKRWPESFVKLYVEDALGERVWVDNEDCKGFVDNILCGINTKQSPNLEPDMPPRPEPFAGVDEDALPTPSRSKDNPDFPVFSRYSSNMETVEASILEIVKEHLNRRQSVENISRNFLKFLASACGLVEIRVLIAPRLEVWLQNPKLMRPAQELLMSLCVNCTAHTQRDVEVISALVKIRLKTKALINYYLACIKELISAHSDNLATVLKHTIYNELSTSHNPNNMPMLGVMLQYSPDQSAALLADIFQELLLNRDDFLRPLRSLVREIWRVLRADLNLAALCRGLMSQTEPVPRDCDNSQRAFNSIADLITLCIFLAVAHLARQDKRDPAQVEKMQLTVAGIQSDAIWWLQETALRVYRPSSSDFVHALQKVLLMEPADQYFKTDSWPQEQDRTLLLRLASEVPLEQATLLRLLVIGLSKEHPLPPPDALHLADQLVRRAAAVPATDTLPMLRADKLELMDLVLNLCAYHHPENIDLPCGYTPPALAITNLYWKGWTLLLILAAHNPTTVGALAWQKHPTLRSLMEMCITNHFVFPAAAAADDLQLAALEKQTILQFETHLAAASTKMAITQQTSLLLSQLMSMEPTGPARQPPQSILEQLQALNLSLRLGHLLCRSRNPDFLLDIIQRQGASQSMPWLADLVHSSDGSLNHLPVQCLCEFLLSSNAVAKQQEKYQQLLTHLQSILSDPNQDPLIVCEILDYFLRRLSSPHSRAQAIMGMKLVLKTVSDEEVMETDKPVEVKDDASWLVKQLPMLPHFTIAKSQVIQALRSACQVENDPALVTAYLCFLAQHLPSDMADMNELVVDMAQLIVERSTIMAAILPPATSAAATADANVSLDSLISIFSTYLVKAREPRREAYTWSESQDQIIVSWPAGEDCTLHILVVHAMVILLTYGPLSVASHADYEYLLDAWFPLDKDTAPKAFLVDTSEEALLIPDWLKLRMIRSQVPRLVEAALTDLEPPQLILFIQSFGIPVASMSKLLETLDRAVMEDREAVGEAVMDKSYMVQLVEVQHKRGATGGDTFARVLGLQEPMRFPDTPVIAEPQFPELKPLVCTKLKSLSLPEAIAVFEKIYSSHEETEAVKLINREDFKLLQRTLSVEVSRKSRSGQPVTSVICQSLLVHLLKRLSSDRQLLDTVAARTHFSCPLFRLLTTVNSEELVTVLLVICKIVQDSPKCSSLLAAILKAFAKKHQHKEMTVIANTSAYAAPVQALEKCPPSELERVGRKVLESNAGKAVMVEAVGKLMRLVPQRLPNFTTGLLIDWLIQIEPEIISSSTDFQMRVLFSRLDNEEFISVKTCRPYLLTLLIHQASWSTLHLCMNGLLKDAMVSRYDPTAVLDFLTALTRSPKLWQGRDKYLPKHYQPEDILNLSSNQIICVADYIVEEAILMNDKKESLDKMNHRIQLLSQCIVEDEVYMTSCLVRHLHTVTSHCTGIRNEMCRQLMMLLYLRVPSLISQATDVNLERYLDSTLVSGSVNSVLDRISHTILTALTATPHAKDWARRSQELELAARKMASTHPLLVLRQLKMIGAALCGRVHLDSGVLRSRGHLALFQHVYGLLELLKPKVFAEEYTESLQSILKLYFQLFKNHGHMKEVINLMNKVVSFLQDYISHDASRALSYLQSQSNIISELQTQHSNFSGLCIMMSGATGSGEVVVAVPPSANQHSATPHFDFANLLRGDDVLACLQELDKASVWRVALLEPALGSLCRYLTSRSSAIRSLAHGLLARYLRFAPQAARSALPAFISCLDSPHPDVIATALDRLPEITVCCQELALPLLKKVFAVGMTSSISITQCTTKTLALLNLQSGC